MYRSYKEFNGYSTAFRQWRANSHCKYVHGYALRFKVLEDVGCEKFAEYVFKYLNKKIKEETDDRVKVHKVQCWEHGENMAEYYE